MFDTVNIRGLLGCIEAMAHLFGDENALRIDHGAEPNGAPIIVALPTSWLSDRGCRRWSLS